VLIFLDVEKIMKGKATGSMQMALPDF